MEPLLLFKPVSAFKHDNMLYFQCCLTLLIFLYCYYQCKTHQNVSRTDKIRGAIPIIWTIGANLHYYSHQQTLNLRLLVISFLITLWGLRMLMYMELKLNKRGQFQQDSRWNVLYTFIYHPKRPYVWEFFVFFGVNMVQIGCWSLMVNMPLFLVYSHPQSSSFLTDCILILLFIVFLTVETVADNQMVKFRQIKAQKMLEFNSADAMGGDPNAMQVERGGVFHGWKYDFMQTGLYSYCCHPNYFGELGLWGCFYLFGAGHGSVEWYSWSSILGVIGYLSLGLKLYKLSKITEGILRYSYASYWRYRASHLGFIPWKELEYDESQQGVEMDHIS